VGAARELTWIQTASAPTFLHNSPALHYLKDEYYSDEVGMSPTRAAGATIPGNASTFIA
jgi:hypothetical protein